MVVTTVIVARVTFVMRTETVWYVKKRCNEWALDVVYQAVDIFRARPLVFYRASNWYE